MKKENKSFFAHIAGGFVGGYISFLIGDPIKAFLAILVILVVMIKGLDIVMGKEKTSWWIKNGSAVYIMVSIVFWIFLYNV